MRCAPSRLRILSCSGDDDDGGDGEDDDGLDLALWMTGSAL